MHKFIIRKAREIAKGWGSEIEFANHTIANPSAGYCGKLLCYNVGGVLSSGHFHSEKIETFYVFSGKFIIYGKDENGFPTQFILVPTDVVDIPNGTPHQIECIEPGIIIEASTPHFNSDVVRIAPGASQRKPTLKEYLAEADRIRAESSQQNFICPVDECSGDCQRPPA